MIDANTSFQRYMERLKLKIPPEFKLSPPIRTMRGHLQCRERCLYVAKGPSLAHATTFADYGHTAAVNESCLKIDGPIDYAFFYDHVALERTREVWSRIRTFVMSAILYNDDPGKNRISLDEIEGLPRERVLTFYEDQHPWNLTSLATSLAEDRFLNVDTSVMGLHFLAMAGYRDILLVGHDGGLGYADGMLGPRPDLTQTRDFARYRTLMETVAKLLADKYRMTIRFYDGVVISPSA